ncbi:hypothetical protein [Streptomyces sp. RFCAC02]|uniref:hypothetical protein n=1 Tax=Streptomyces sp. RFCAC02 TaxID=2499143 RepID=UPI001021F67F|nr:hypothetical protein [Streptomyces sp. RFCAC02]
MAFPLNLARPDGDTFPFPTSPVIVADRLRGLRLRLPLIGVLWALVGAAYIAVTASLLFDEPLFAFGGGSPLAATAAYLFLPSVAFAANLVGNQALRQIYGFGESEVPHDSNSCFAPTNGGAVQRCTGCAGFLTGMAAGHFLVPWGAVADAAWWRQAVLGLLLVICLPVVRILRFDWIRMRAARSWRRDSRRVLREVVDGGTHAVATVTAARHTGKWLDRLPVFRLTLTWPLPGGGERTAEIRVTEYPCWAPAEGNTFDVWYDPAAPDDDSRVLLHRRLVGQRFAEDPEKLREPAHGETGTGPLRPSWSPEKPTASAGERVLFFLIALLCAGAGVTAAALTPAAFDALPWYSDLAIDAQAVLLVANACAWGVLLLRRPWFARHRTSVALVTMLPFTGIFTLGLLVLGEDPVWLFEFDRTIETVTAWLYGGTMAAGLVTYLLSFAMLLRGGQLLNAGIDAPPEEVAEALRHHDPAAIDRLRTRYGYIAGTATLS